MGKVFLDSAESRNEGPDSAESGIRRFRPNTTSIALIALVAHSSGFRVFFVSAQLCAVYLEICGGG
jgi:hypothetical protein